MTGAMAYVRWALTMAAFIGLSGTTAGGATAEDTRPNIVIILADDAGYADFGFMGSAEFETPHIDELARSGVTYSDAYATTPFCSPSRAALLTGRYPQRYGYEFNLTHAPPKGVDPAYMGLDVEEETIGKLFKEAGYSTITIGKWHVGSKSDYHPNVRGFDHFYGMLGGSSPYRPRLIGHGTIERNGIAVTPRDYLTDDFAREAAEQIAANRDRPFLLYLAFNAVHTPMHANPDDLARFAHIEDRQRRILAAMTWSMDRAIGRVLAALEQNGVAGRTIVVFSNDNGGDRIGLDASNAPLNGTKGTLLEGGIRVPLVIRFPNGWSKGETRGEPVSLLDIVPTVLAAAHVAIPDDLDGRDLRNPTIGNEQRDLFWRYGNAAAVRSGNWKLIRFPDRPVHLFDLTSDIGEQNNLASEHPKVVTEMLLRLFDWEAVLEQPRWHTGTFWTQEDIRRYSKAYVDAKVVETKAMIAMSSQGEDQ